MIIIDAHEDLAWNMLSFGRDYTQTVSETRRKEAGTEVPKLNGDTLLGWDAYQQGEIAVVFSTLFAAPVRARLGSWDTQFYTTSEEAHRHYRAQLDAYHRLADQHPEKFRIIRGKQDLRAIIGSRDDNEAKEHPVGLVILMENAEGIRTPDELPLWWENGVRIIGPAWAGTRFCGGTREPGPLTPEGFALLDGMADLGFILDISHMDEKAVLQSLDYYPKTIMASHANAKALIKGTESNRFLSDNVIRRLARRNGVIGVVPYNRFLQAGWQASDGKESVSLEKVAEQIDYICQLTGDAGHVGLGTDFDGGFGVQKAPAEVDTIADLQKLAPILAGKGFSDADIGLIFYKNWLLFLERAWSC